MATVAGETRARRFVCPAVPGQNGPSTAAGGKVFLSVRDFRSWPGFVMARLPRPYERRVISKSMRRRARPIMGPMPLP